MKAAAPGGRSARPCIQLLLALALPALNPGCSCSGNGHIRQGMYTAHPGDDVVNCNCNLSFDHPACVGGTCAAHFALQLCIPPALQTGSDAIVVRPADGGSNDGGSSGADAALSSPFATAVDQYCRQTVTNIVYHVISVFNGGWCSYKAPYAPLGGIGRSVECFAEPIVGLSATTTDDGTCRTQCGAVACDYAVNCGQGVQDPTGNIDLDRCQCSLVTQPYGCAGDPQGSLPTAVFCRPPPGTVKL